MSTLGFDNRTFSDTLVLEKCCVCGIAFGMPADFQAYIRRDKRMFYCPNGHGQSYTHNEADKLRDELTRERARLDQARAEAAGLRRRGVVKDHQLRARKAVATKLRNRIAAGKCPCCHTRFKDLAEHMKAEHPKWSPDKAAEAIAAKRVTTR